LVDTIVHDDIGLLKTGSPDAYRASAPDDGRMEQAISWSPSRWLAWRAPQHAGVAAAGQ
jgi:hypothetical protein